MAPRKKAAKPAVAKPRPSDGVKPSDLMKMPTAADVQEIAAEIREAKTASGTTAERIAESIAEAKSQQGIHPEAVKKVEALLFKAKKTDRGLVAVGTFLAHLDYYRDVLGLTKLLEDQGQMFKRSPLAPAAAAAGGAEPDDEIPEDERDLRPTHLRQPAAQPDAETPPGTKTH